MISGTLPVVYQGAQYFIPLRVVVGEYYPHHGPTAFVVPTATMVIQPTPYCDVSGRVYHPYLASWTDASSLLHLLRNLMVAFGSCPPVRAHVAPPTQPPPQPQPQPQPHQQQPPAHQQQPPAHQPAQPHTSPSHIPSSTVGTTVIHRQQPPVAATSGSLTSSLPSSSSSSSAAAAAATTTVSLPAGSAYLSQSQALYQTQPPLQPRAVLQPQPIQQQQPQSQSQHQQQPHHSQSTGLYGSSGSLTQAIPLPSGPPPSYQASRLESRHRLQQRTKQQLDAFVAKAQADLAQTKALDEQIQRLAQEKEQLTVQTQQLAAETAAIRQWLETHGAAAEFDIDRATQADTPIKIQYARASRASILCVRCEVC